MFSSGQLRRAGRSSEKLVFFLPGPILHGDTAPFMPRGSPTTGQVSSRQIPEGSCLGIILITGGTGSGRGCHPAMVRTWARALALSNNAGSPTKARWPTRIGGCRDKRMCVYSCAIRGCKRYFLLFRDHMGYADAAFHQRRPNPALSDGAWRRCQGGI
jgi:hypothetical protein